MQACHHKLQWAFPAPEVWRLGCRQAYGDLYHATDFHHREGAGCAEHGNCQIQDQDFQGCYDCVQQCDLGGLADLDTSQSSVQVMHNHLSLGVLKAYCVATGLLMHRLAMSFSEFNRFVIPGWGKE